jgi:hypothetical protein
MGLSQQDPERGKRIIGVIDHHALAESFSTSRPLFMDLRAGHAPTIQHAARNVHLAYNMQQLPHGPFACVRAATTTSTLHTKPQAHCCSASRRIAPCLLRTLGRSVGVDEYHRRRCPMLKHCLSCRTRSCFGFGRSLLSGDRFGVQCCSFNTIRRCRKTSPSCCCVPSSQTRSTSVRCALTTRTERGLRPEPWSRGRFHVRLGARACGRAHASRGCAVAR